MDRSMLLLIGIGRTPEGAARLESGAWRMIKAPDTP
jgi:hypothetical protein